MSYLSGSFMQSLGWQDDNGHVPLSFEQRLQLHGILVVGVSGKIGSGKTSLCSTLMQRYGVLRCVERNFADALKEQVATHLGISKEACYSQQGKQQVVPGYDGATVGRILQSWGTGLRQAVHPNVWVNGVRAWLATRIDAMSLSVQSTSSEDDSTSDDQPALIVLIGDMRFPNELAFVQQECGGIAIRLEGDPNGVRSRSNRDLQHISETALDDCRAFELCVNTDVVDKDAMTNIVATRIERAWCDRQTRRRMELKRTFERRIVPLLRSIQRWRREHFNKAMQNVRNTLPDLWNCAFNPENDDDDEEEEEEDVVRMILPRRWQRIQDYVCSMAASDEPMTTGDGQMTTLVDMALGSRLQGSSA